MPFGEILDPIAAFLFNCLPEASSMGALLVCSIGLVLFKFDYFGWFRVRVGFEVSLGLV